MGQRNTIIMENELGAKTVITYWKKPMKHNKEQIIELYKAGNGIREIQRQLGISSPAVVSHHIRGYEKGKPLDDLANYIMENFPEYIKTEGAIQTALEILKEFRKHKNCTHLSTK